MSLERIVFADKLRVLLQQLPKAYEGTHDLHVHERCLFSTEHARQHGYPLLSEGQRQIPAGAAVSWNMKSWGNRACGRQGGADVVAFATSSFGGESAA